MWKTRSCGRREKMEVSNSETLFEDVEDVMSRCEKKSQREPQRNQTRQIETILTITNKVLSQEK